jgi:hypothetical protein
MPAMVTLGSISAAPWLLWTWIPAGLMGLCLEWQGFRWLDRLEHGHALKRSVGLEAMLFACCFGWIMIMRASFFVVIFPFAWLMTRDIRRTRDA